MQNTDTPPRPHSLRLSRRTQHFRNIRFLDPAPLHLKPCVRRQSVFLDLRCLHLQSLYNNSTSFARLVKRQGQVQVAVEGDARQSLVLLLPQTFFLFEEFLDGFDQRPV